VNSASTNIPSTFANGNGSLILTGIRNVTSILVDNRTLGEVAVNCSSVAPPSSDTNSFFVNAQNAWAIDDALLGGTCWLRSNTGSAITNGVVVVTVIGG
jgi:hypothetical protein